MQTKFYWTILAMLVFLSAEAQLDTPTLYRYNWQVFNPAAIDITQLLPADVSTKNDRTIIGISGRHKWLGSKFPDQPTLLNGRMEKYPRITGKGLQNFKFKWGLYGLYDKAGPIQTAKAQASIAGLIPLNRSASHILSIGLGVGIITRVIDFEEIHFKDGLSTSPTSDPFIAPNLSGGIFYTFFNKEDGAMIDVFYIGLSFPQVTQLNPELILDQPINREDNAPYITSKNTTYFVVGTKLLPPFWNAHHAIEPSIWVSRYRDAYFQTFNYDSEKEEIKGLPLSADFNIRYTHDHYDYDVWAGLGFGSNKMLHTEAGVRPKGENCKTQLYSYSVAASFPISWESLLGPAIEFNVTFSFD